METHFHDKHQVLPVTYLPATTFYLPLSMGFHMFAQLPPSHHCIWFYETFPYDTVPCLAYIHLVLSTTWTPVFQKINAQTVSGILTELMHNQSAGVEMLDSSSLSLDYF